MEKRINIKNEVASEIPDTADLPAINPSISDIILQLDLNKVIEIDIEHLKNAIERRILVKERKIQSKSIPDTDVGPLTYNVGREKIVDKIKTQRKSHPGVNLFKNRYMSTQHQEDFFTSHTAPHKFSTNRISFPSFGNQGMDSFKNKNMFSHHKDFLMKNITTNKFPTKVINLSPFDNLEGSEYISLHLTEPPKAHHRTSRGGSTICKTIQFPSMNKEPSGHRKNSISNKKNVELTLPAVISTTKKPIHEVSHTAARKSLPHHIFENK